MIVHERGPTERKGKVPMGSLPMLAEVECPRCWRVHTVTFADPGVRPCVECPCKALVEAYYKAGVNGTPIIIGSRVIGTWTVTHNLYGSAFASDERR